MEVKYHQPLTSDDIEQDPANYAQEHGLVDNHEPWVRNQIGVWRWIGLHKYKDRILSLVKGAYTIDLGGAAAPLGYGAHVVDYWSEHRSLYDLPPKADVVFASHFLEHVADLHNCLAAIADKLRDGGHIICMVPSFHFESLRADVWAEHEQTFCLSSDSEQFTALDLVLSRWFDLEVCEYTDIDRPSEPGRTDKCIFAIGVKK